MQAVPPGLPVEQGSVDWVDLTYCGGDKVYVHMV